MYRYVGINWRGSKHKNSKPNLMNRVGNNVVITFIHVPHDQELVLTSRDR